MRRSVQHSDGEDPERTSSVDSPHPQLLTEQFLLEPTEGRLRSFTKDRETTQGTMSELASKTVAKGTPGRHRELQWTHYRGTMSGHVFCEAQGEKPQLKTWAMKTWRKQTEPRLMAAGSERLPRATADGPLPRCQRGQEQGLGALADLLPPGPQRPRRRSLEQPRSALMAAPASSPRRPERTAQCSTPGPCPFDGR